MYLIIRFYQNAGIRRRIIGRVPTLALAQEHCNSPESSCSTCTSKAGKARTRRCGPWFDGYMKR